ncbi:MAG: 50S ribosomal protein L4 [Eubacteriales bacterium]|nr:50S ribosomal protein L4 [Eubacteriales bacterium]
MKAKVFNMQNNEVAEVELNDTVFGADYNEALIHEVIVAQDANLRQGTKSTLTRSEVRGHAKKPWKQKHTGHARQGSTKGPQFVGGGVVFAPKPRDFSKKVNKFAKRTALVSALSQKLAQNEVVILDKFVLDAVKTKEVQKFLDTFKFDKTVCLVLNEKNDDVLRATNNIARIDVTSANLLNVSEIVKNKQVVLTLDAVKSIEEAYAE